MRLNVKIVLYATAIMMLSAFVVYGCSAPAAGPETEKPGDTTNEQPAGYDNSAAFKSLSDKLSELEIKSIAIIGVDDMINANIDRERQVYQAILQELTKVPELKVVESDQQTLNKFFQEKGADPSRGLSTDASINLAVLLNVDAIIYGTIESESSDVNIKVYNSTDGGVIFSETIENLKLPLDKKKKEKFEIPPGLLEPESQPESK